MKKITLLSKEIKNADIFHKKLTEILSKNTKINKQTIYLKQISNNFMALFII